MESGRAQNLPIVGFRDQQASADWLHLNHGPLTMTDRVGKEGIGRTLGVHAEAVEVALCYGWIDGQSKANNDDELAPEVHPAAQAQHLVQDQSRKSRTAD